MAVCEKCGKEYTDVLFSVPGDVQVVTVPVSTICPDCSIAEAKAHPDYQEYVPRSGPGDEMSTCYGCPQNETCPWAWDDYNLDGDCIVK